MTSPRRYGPGILIMAAAALVGLIIAAIGYLNSESGIAGTPGALLVILSSAALLIAGLVLPALRERLRWLHVVVVILCMLALLGTIVAAYFLELTLLVAAMLAATAGLALYLFSPARRVEYSQ